MAYCTHLAHVVFRVRTTGGFEERSCHGCLVPVIAIAATGGLAAMVDRIPDPLGCTHEGPPRERRDFGCTDGGCVFGHPGGMHTNGGCKCLDRRLLSEVTTWARARAGVLALRRRIEWLERKVEALGGTLRERATPEGERLAAARDALRAACDDGYTPMVTHRPGCAAAKRREAGACDCGSEARRAAWRALVGALLDGAALKEGA